MDILPFRDEDLNASFQSYVVGRDLLVLLSHNKIPIEEYRRLSLMLEGDMEMINLVKTIIRKYEKT